MANSSPFLRRRVSGSSGVIIVAAVAGLAAASYWAYCYTAKRVFEARLDAALPVLAPGLRAERDHLVTVIEAYKTRFGAYPPDHVLSRHPLIVDPITNTLIYELAGVLHDPVRKTYLVGHLQPADTKFVHDYFQCAGFNNCSTNEAGIHRFLPPDELQRQTLTDDTNVYALSFTVYSEKLAPEVLNEIEPGTWRYVRTAPTNNPQSFDLWIDLKGANRTLTIGNWKAVE